MYDQVMEQFLDMPISTQWLYTNLGLHMDKNEEVNFLLGMRELKKEEQGSSLSPTSKDLLLLISKGYLKMVSKNRVKVLWWYELEDLLVDAD